MRTPLASVGLALLLALATEPSVNAQDAPARMLAQFNDSGKSRRNGNSKDTIRLEVAEAV